MKKMFTSTLVIFAVCALVALVGCEGEKGADGVAGPDGLAGAAGTASCGSCHDVSTDILAKQIQWEQSGHANGMGYWYAGARTGCAECHDSDGFTTKMAGGEAVGNDNPTPQNCRTCHNIHTNYDETDYSLTTTAAVTLTGAVASEVTIDIGKGNLCANCHQTRARDELYVGGPDVDITSTHWGPHHGPQSNVLTGNSGYEVAGSLAYDDSPHAAMIADGCVTCHMAAPGTTSGGHTFKPNTTSCEECHSDVSGFDINGVQTEIKELLHTLAALLEEEGALHEEEGAYHPIAGITLTSAKAGALFNFIMMQVEDGSFGVHNYKYTKALLQNSIEVF